MTSGVPIGCVGEAGVVTPMQLVLLGLGGCAAVDMLAMLRRRGVCLARLSADVEGQQTDAVGAAFERMHMTIRIEASGDITYARRRRSMEKLCFLLTNV